MIDGLGFTEILYADDTLLVVKDPKSASTFLNKIEIQSQYYNMKLNKSKFESIIMNHKGEVTFQNGESMTTMDQAKY